ncbi:hypothetical protein [Priestia endophytica]|jgi:hypothetical protein|uniref:hypothetical protein n=1 Tax=Priestia endophytica TaxID=135735 RepID=UPI000DCA5995|nr:hypothetical protein [Priestia endophytica]RAS87133.1 hypothetical protein A4R27_02015 [Priestia endophytica]
MKKIKMLVMSLIVTLFVPSSVFANTVPQYGSGDWDSLGSDEFTNQSKIFLSGGGDFKICLSSNSQSGFYQLYEEDPYNRDDAVYSNGIRGLYYKTAGSNDFDSNGCHVFKNISHYVDGDQAEFYLAKYSGGNSTVTAWD